LSYNPVNPFNDLTLGTLTYYV